MNIPHRVPLRVACLTAGVTLMGVLTAPALAQSGSANFTAIGAELLPAAGRSTSASFIAESRLSSPVGGLVATSANFQAVGPIAFVSDLAGSEAPMLFAVTPNNIEAGSFASVTLAGQNFDELAAGSATVTFGSEPPVPVTVVNSTTATATAPAGLDAFANPTARVDVEYVNALGTSELAGGAVFTPAIEVTDPAEVGGSLTIRYSDTPGDLLSLYFKNSILATPIPLGGFLGSLVLNPPGNFIQNLPCGPSGFTDLVVGLPNNPTLAGATFYLQGIGVDAGGAPPQFTNVPLVFFLP